MKKAISLYGAALVLAALALTACLQNTDGDNPSPAQTPNPVARVVISGSPQTGQTLSAAAYDSAGAAVTAAYQWQRGTTAAGPFTDIPGAVLQQYLVISGDQDQYLRVTASNSAAPAPVASDPLGPVTAEGTEQPSGDVDWTNYQTAGTYAIRVKNESNIDLIAFKSSLTAANMLGGVRKNETDHGFKLNTALFNQNTDFSIIFITVDQYNANKSNLSALEQQPFTRLFAVYNATGTNEVPWIVSGKLGGTNKLVINNMTRLNMELRQDSPRGTTLGYAPYQSNNTRLFMNDGSFYVYPVFKSYNPARDEILTIYPIAADGLPVGDEFSFSNGNELTINAANYTGNASFSSGTAKLVVKNNSKQGITVCKGSAVQKTETGISTINAGDERTFSVLMPDNGNGRYAETDSFSGWKIVNMGTREKEIPSITTDGGKIAADYRYTVTVEGDWNSGTASVSAPEKSAEKFTTEFGDF